MRKSLPWGRYGNFLEPHIFKLADVGKKILRILDSIFELNSQRKKCLQHSTVHVAQLQIYVIL